VKRIASVVVLAVGALGLLVAWGALPIRKGNEITPASNPPITDGTYVKGLHYKVHENGSLVSEAEAEDFRIVPKRFFVFRVKSVNEAVVTNARIKLFKLNDSRKDSKDDPFGSLLKEFGDSGLIVKAVVNGIDVNIYKAEKVTHHLTAAKADLMAGANQTAFYDAAIEHPPSKTVIRTAKLLWDTEKRKFRVPGQYTASGPGGEFRGKGVQIDLNFKMERMKSS
jgi:hypothetical protein